jgi:predicted RecA/RadA family phage recombinase
MQNFVQDGLTVRYVNAGSSRVVAGQLVAYGDHVGVAVNDIPVGDEGVLQTWGVFELPKKATIALTRGARVYLHYSEFTITNVATTVISSTTYSNPVVGVAWEDAAAAAPSAIVKINV